MTPRRSTYKPPRPRHEIVVAVAASVGLTVITGVAVWALGPHTSSTAPPAPQAPSSVATTAPSTPASSTPSTPPRS